MDTQIHLLGISGMFIIIYLKPNSIKLDQNHLRILYFSLIHPYLNHGSVLWGSAQQKYVHILEIMQNKAMWVIQNLKYNSSAKPTYKKLKVLPIVQLYQQLGKLLLYLHRLKKYSLLITQYTIIIQRIQMIHTFHNTLLAWWYPVLYIKLQKYGT